MVWTGALVVGADVGADDCVGASVNEPYGSSSDGSPPVGVGARVVGAAVGALVVGSLVSSGIVGEFVNP